MLESGDNSLAEKSCERRSGSSVLRVGWMCAIAGAALASIAIYRLAAHSLNSTGNEVIFYLSWFLICLGVGCGVVGLFYRRWLAGFTLMVGSIVVYFSFVTATGVVGTTSRLVGAFASGKPAATRSASVAETVITTVPEDTAENLKECQVPSNPERAVALVVLIEKSGHMKKGNLLESIKKGVAAAIETVPDESCVAVIGFDENPYVVIDMQRAMRVRKQAAERLGLLTPFGKVDLAPALTLAREKLELSAARRKEVVIISTGKFGAAAGALPEEVGRLRESSVTISTVSVGKPIVGSYLPSLSKHGGGTSYMSAEGLDLRDVLVGEIEKSRELPE